MASKSSGTEVRGGTAQTNTSTMWPGGEPKPVRDAADSK